MEKCETEDNSGEDPQRRAEKNCKKTLALKVSLRRDDRDCD